jgi:hypothetical protein
MKWTIIFLALATGRVRSGLDGQLPKQQNKPAPIKSLSILLVPGYGSHIGWRAIILRRDGSATKMLDGPFEHVTYKAKGLRKDFDLLVQMANDYGYIKMDSYYGTTGSDMPFTTVAITYGRTRKVIEDGGQPFITQYGKIAPEGLQKIEKQLFEIYSRDIWTKVKYKPEAWKLGRLPEDR